MKYTLPLCLMFYATVGFSQEKSTIEESLSYFKDGAVFEHKPTNFKTTFRFRIQGRMTYDTKDAENFSADAVDLTVRRTRLRFDGHLLDPRLLYKLQLSFSRGDIDYERNEQPNILRDAAVGWKLSDSTTFWYGQTKLPGNRQRVVSSGEQQLVDRSLVNANFNLDRDLGAQVYHRLGEERPFWIKLAVSNGEGRASENEDNGLAYTSRIEWLPLGEFTDDGDYFEADLMREPKPKFSIGAVYSVNKKTTRPGGQLGNQFNTPGLNRDIETWFVDALYKYRGFSWQAEYAKRWTHDPVIDDSGETVTVYKGQGFNTQMGYVFDNNIEPSVRFTKLFADRETLLGDNDQTQYTVGLSKYINRHRIKVQTDVSYNEVENRVLKEYSSNWSYRLQFEVGI